MGFESNIFFGNEWFALSVYLLPLLVPRVRVFTLAAIVFAFAVLMHLFNFNIAIKVWYNPGMETAVFGLLPVSLNYLFKVVP